jgi:hypothetical protein
MDKHLRRLKEELLFFILAKIDIFAVSVYTIPTVCLWARAI